MCEPYIFLIPKIKKYVCIYCYNTSVSRTFYTSMNDQRCLIPSFTSIVLHKYNIKHLLPLLGKSWKKAVKMKDKKKKIWKRKTKIHGVGGGAVVKFLSEKLVSWSPWGPQFMKDQDETLMETLWKQNRF